MSLEKELKELKAKSTKSESQEEPSTLMGSGLGQRLMIGGPGQGYVV
jgi:clathrin heavy chain